MKKNFLLLALFLSQFLCCFSQTIEMKGNALTIDTTAALYPMFKKTNNPILPAIQDSSKKEIIWAESGTGSFITDPTVTVNISGKQGHKPLLLSTRIYDTSDIPPRTRVSYDNMSLINTGGKNSFTNMLPLRGVKIIPSVTDIVPGDPMVFAIIYKTDAARVINNPKGGLPETEIDSSAKFQLHFFCNNNNTFTPITQEGNLNGLPIPNIRTHNGEKPIFGSAIPTSLNKVIGSFNFKNWFYYDIPNNTSLEKAVFVSVMPYANLEIGKSGSVYAILTDANGNIIGADSILNMRFAPSHDPNYLVQRPVCLLYDKNKAKKVYPFDYNVHFQNTGAGDAKEVKVIVHLPKGLNYNTFKVRQATFAGIDYTIDFNNILSNKNLIIDRVNNTIKIIFDGSTRSAVLFGTASSLSPSTDEKTMGEIFFTIKSTPNVEDSLKAFAEIYFKSVHPSKYITVDGYEIAVTTNKAITRYKECCTCSDVPPIAPPVPPHIPIIPPPTSDNCFTILGLCWWLWILVVISVLFIWWLISQKKKNKQNQINHSSRSQY
jgi:hypothetical protein